MPLCCCWSSHAIVYRAAKNGREGERERDMYREKKRFFWFGLVYYFHICTGHTFNSGTEHPGDICWYMTLKLLILMHKCFMYGRKVAEGGATAERVEWRDAIVQWKARKIQYMSYKISVPSWLLPWWKHSFLFFCAGCFTSPDFAACRKARERERIKIHSTFSSHNVTCIYDFNSYFNGQKAR